MCRRGARLEPHSRCASHGPVLTYLALAGGTSRSLTRLFSSHGMTMTWLLEQLLPVRFQVRQKGAIDLRYGRARARLTGCVQTAASIIEGTSLHFRRQPFLPSGMDSCWRGANRLVGELHG
jgi:hypothetical protein